MADEKISIDGEDNRNSMSSSDNDDHLTLAQDVCKAAEQGEFTEVLSILKIPATDQDSSLRSGDVSDECNQLLFTFHKLIGYHGVKYNNVKYTAAETPESLVLPHSVRAHLLLRGLLRIPHDKYRIPW